MKFVIDNWSLFLIAIVSGALLIWPLVRGAVGGDLTPARAVQLINRDKAVVIDVRETEEFASGARIVGARNIPLGELEAKLPGAVKNKAVPVILVCSTGGRASRALPIVKKLGYEQAQALAGGLKAWKDANLPLEKA
ncbi:rhodanese-like domain-containing protein [Xylophilus rhododendri]|uniref:Rhodanese-like domain-containing protein n=1 Tax=Xylophilus rhododendri TaxID=2697032 RepID=A0A857J8U5_9BURK|nr:rhodanese-like domain-containing protein [Xylophilus rhododendri]QHI99432.1 rhodanese-like domain-containing protein [Xylophilus rhododendri]